jgi:drug/metabolite transporter (DMT)-like permease
MAMRARVRRVWRQGQGIITIGNVRILKRGHPPARQDAQMALPLSLPGSVRWLLMVLPFALWGTAMAATGPLVGGASPAMLAALRLLPAGAVLLLAAALLGRPLAVATADRPWLLLFALVDGTLFQGFLARGLGQTGAVLGSVLIDSQPLLVALLARVLFNEAINPVGWCGLLLGLAGIVCLGLRGRCCSNT